MKTKIYFGSDIFKIIASFFIVILFYTSAFSKAKKPEEKYFISNSNARIDFQFVDGISSDSLFIRTGDLVSVLLIDSIAEYHHYKSGKGLKGFLIGAAAGSLAGGIIGALISPSDDNTSGYEALGAVNSQAVSTGLGVLFGFIVGGGIGFLGGNSQHTNVNVDLRHRDRESKKIVLQQLFLVAGN